MMLWTWVKREACSWLSCIYILSRSMGQSASVARVEEIIEAVRSIIKVGMMLKLNLIIGNSQNNHFNIMICNTHREPIKYVCSSDNCHYLPLCQSCHIQHSRLHQQPQIMPLASAIIEAEHNLTRQRKMISQLKQPFDRRVNYVQKLQEQRKQLQKQKQRLIREISKMIEEEISKLNKQNHQIQKIGLDKQRDSSLKKDFLKLQKQISQMQQSYRNKPQSLRKAMNLELKEFVQQTIINNQQFYGACDFKLYATTNHHFILNQLSMVSANAALKPIRKVMNQSPLYFLIDPKYSTADDLFHFSSFKQSLHIYNVKEDNWQSHHIKDHNNSINSEGFGIHDRLSKRFLLIGGISSGRSSWSIEKSKKILIFNYGVNKVSQRWQERSLLTARSSCMATIVASKGKDKTSNYGVLIAGGKNNNDQIQKSCQFLNLQTMEITPFSQMNFGAFYGCLVTFNGSSVIRIGGLNKNKTDYSVLQIVEKVDCSAWLEGDFNNKLLPKWSYIQLELPKGDILSKPRLFFANQAAIQINPNQIFVFGGLDSGLYGTTESYLISVEQFNATGSRQVRGELVGRKQQRYCIRWVNQKPLISGDDFRGGQAIISGERIFVLQSKGNREQITWQKRLLQFDMYQWFETQNILPQ